MKKELYNIFFIDIETVPLVPSYDSLPQNLKALWDKKAAQLASNTLEIDSAEYFHKKGGIYAEFGKIIVIGIGFFFSDEEGNVAFKCKSYHGHDEKSILTELAQLLQSKSKSSTRLCAHNGKEFDFPYLCRRMIVHGVPIPEILQIQSKKPWEVRHLDTMDLWKFGDKKSYASLDLLAALFGIPSSKGAMEGSQVAEYYYVRQDLDAISRYCLKDVWAMAQVYAKLVQVPLPQDIRVVQMG